MRVAITALAFLAFIGFTAGTASAEAPSKPTYTKDVAPIMFKKCTNCHRAGQIGPMSLLTYKEVRPWAKSIAANVASKAMPPWDADHGYGPWVGDRSMSQDEIDTIVSWVNDGAPRGNRKDMPDRPKYGKGEWTLGEPDYVIEFDSYDIPAGGPDRFYDHNYQTDLSEDKWITKVEILPGASEVLHHVILWKGDRGTGNAQGWIGAWAAGAMPMEFYEGSGRMLKKGSVIRGDMHYHPTDKSYSDATRVGFHFADGGVDKELVNLWVINAEFKIPAGAPNHEVRSQYTFAQDSHLISLLPHMHYRGKDFVYTATFPGGETQELLKVSDYDFGWQTEYRFETPVSVPKGTVIDCVAHFDNSADNLENPDPTKDITFGNESYDEMMIGFIDYVVDDGMSAIDPMMARISVLVEEHPGSVFTLKVPLDPSNGPQTTALVIPKEGDGGWYIRGVDEVIKATIKNIVWTDNDFSAIAVIPGQGEAELSGSINPAAQEVTINMMGFPLKGEIAK
jgi:hypothetical protein